MQVTPMRMDGTMQGKFLGTGNESSLSLTDTRVMFLSQPASTFPNDSSTPCKNWCSPDEAILFWMVEA